MILKAILGEDVRRIGFTPSSFEKLSQQICQLFSLPQGSFTLKYKDDEGDLVSLSSDEELKECLNCSEKNILRISVIKNDQQPQRPGWGGWKQWKQWKGWKGGDHHERGHCKRFFKGWRQHQHQQPPFFQPPPFFRQQPCSEKQQECPEKQQECPQTQPQMQPQMQRPFCLRRGFPFLGPVRKVIQSLKEGKFDPIVENFLQSGVIEVEHNHICDGCESRIKGKRYHCTGCPDFDFCQSCFEGEKRSSHPEHNFEEITAIQALRNAFFGGQEQQPESQTPKEEPTINTDTEQETPKEEPINTSTPYPQPQEVSSDQPTTTALETPVKEEEKKEEKGTFGEKLKDLSVMGFDDKRRNIQLLIKHKGDLQKVVEELLN